MALGKRKQGAKEATAIQEAIKLSRQLCVPLEDVPEMLEDDRVAFTWLGPSL